MPDIDVFESFPMGPSPRFPNSAPATPAPAQSPARSPTPAPSQPAQGRPAPSKPNKLDHPEFAEVAPKFQLGESERERSPALTKSRSNVITIHTEGTIGDLDNEGLDLLAGYIARINGVGFTASSAHQAKNPGGFGLTLRTRNGSPFSHLLPMRDIPGWMAPLVDDLQKKLSIPNPLKFPRWEEGGEALMEYLRLIQIGKIPYFYRGPLTPITELLLCYEAPFSTTETYAWRKLLPLLTSSSATVVAHNG